MRVALEKVDGVTTVNVTLKEGRAKLTLRPGNTVTLAEIRRVIERNGFTPQAAAVLAEAEEIHNAAGQSQIKISGSNETFVVAQATTVDVRAELKKQTGKRIIVEGVVPAPKNNPTPSIEIKTVKPTGK